VNIGILGIAGFVSVKSQIDRKNRPDLVTAPAVTTVTIMPVLPVAPTATTPAETPPPTEGKPSFVRTSGDQANALPDKPAFIGERDTLATSDRAPDANAPPLPSQKGEKPRNPDDLETTESDYQDGILADSQPLPAAPPQAPTPPAPMTDPGLAEAASPGETVEIPGNDLIKSSPPPREKLLEGPNPVDVAVPLDVPKAETIKPTPPKFPKPEEKASNVEESPKPKPERPPVPNDPVFSGNQRKKAIVGSISRSGRSALDVADSPLGRYQAVISRAVEQEWQRNCVRHRDFITPGFLTVRFFVETSGKVRTVQFVGQMETGEVQKGFTLNSIRDAEIPAMPAAVKKDFAKEPLELIFNFYF
jgi:hypothetical protein